MAVVVIPPDRKWFRDFAISSMVIEKLISSGNENRASY
jgi:hypothetical protein